VIRLFDCSSVTASQSKDVPGCINLATAVCPMHAYYAGPAEQDCIAVHAQYNTLQQADKWTIEQMHE